MYDTLYGYVQNYLPNLLVAAGILIGGTLAAWILAALVRFLLRKVRKCDCLGLCPEDGEANDSGYGESIAGQIVFWILMVFVLAGFFQALGLHMVSDPLINMMQNVFGYIPRPLAAILLTALAWILARSARLVIIQALERMNLDESVSREMTVPPGAIANEECAGRVRLSHALGEVGYWLVLLLFVPLVLDALGLHGLLVPIQEMLNKALGFLPNVFVASLILVFGYFAAKIVSRIVANLLSASGIDQVVKRVEPSAHAKHVSLSKLIGYIVFVLILVPIVISALQALQLEAVTRPAEEMLATFLTALPHLFAAIGLLAIAYLVGRLLGEMAGGLLGSTGFDAIVRRMGLTKIHKQIRKDHQDEGASPAPVEDAEHHPSQFIGRVVMVAVMLVASEAALRLVGFVGLAELLGQVIAFLGHLIVGMVIIGVGLYLASLAARLIRGSDLASAEILAPLSRAAIIVFTGAMGLEQMGIGQDIIRLAFGLIVGAIAVAAAIAFGIGSRDVAHSIVNKRFGHLGERSESADEDSPSQK